ncbi:Protein FAR1-RELATED SEQUENCE 5 [Linum perenne]
MASINMAADIGLHSSFQILCKQLGGERNVGCTKVDIKSFLNKFRQKRLLYGEESAINEYFRAKTERELDFFWATEMDLEDRIANIFWADSRMRDDYVCFGDSITFDTTYRTNEKCRLLMNVFFTCRQITNLQSRLDHIPRISSNRLLK